MYKIWTQLEWERENEIRKRERKKIILETNSPNDILMVL